MARVSPFSIHQELWHDCWVAATAAARAKKKQVDFSIQQRVARLLEDYGPGSGMPLTLRVYGTMLKGFCVINNERARALHAECERVVFVFSQQAFGDEGKAMRLPPARRRQAEALTLDINLADVRESEAFDWTQGPLEEGALLRYVPGADLAMVIAPEEPAPQLSDLPDESFPALSLPATGRPDSTSKAAAEAAAAAVAAPEPAPSPVRVSEVALVPAPVAVVPPDTLARRPQRPFRPFGPGRVFGFDEETMVPHEVLEAWERDGPDISNARAKPAAQAERLPAPKPDHLGQLRVLLDQQGELRVAARAGCAADRGPELDGRHAEQEWALPGPPAADRGELLRMGPATPVGALVPVDAATAAAPGPLVAEPPLQCARGADVELGEIFSSQQPPTLPKKRGRERGPPGCGGDQTAAVAAVLRRCVEAGTGEARSVTLDDFLPPPATPQATAAQTFAALLALATAGELRVEQRGPYMPISILAA